MNQDYKLNSKCPDESMKVIADDLMNNWLIQVGAEYFRICEIEFYFSTRDEHNDPYIHGKDIQNNYGKWYFHGSGLDLTIGRDGYSASILIRAINQLNVDDGYTYGPLNSIQKLFSVIDECAQRKLVFGLVLSQEQKFTREKPIAAKRVGLNQKKDPDMCDALYRFLVMPKSKHVNKTGIAEAMRSSYLYTEEEINRIWG